MSPISLASLWSQDVAECSRTIGTLKETTMNGEATIPTYEEFGELARNFLSKHHGGAAEVDKNAVIVLGKRGEPSAAFSLDKMYRFFVNDAVSDPKASHEEHLARMAGFLNQWREKTGRGPVFRLVTAETPRQVVIEQCCIR
jgi:hypothetical protein